MDKLESDLTDDQFINELITSLLKLVRLPKKVPWEKSKNPDSFILKVNETNWLKIEKNEDNNGNFKYILAVYDGVQEIISCSPSNFNENIFMKNHEHEPDKVFKEIYEKAKLKAMDYPKTMKNISKDIDSLIA